jgi:hypothetical protein
LPGDLVSGKKTLVSRLNAMRLAIQPLLEVVYIQLGTWASRRVDFGVVTGVRGATEFRESDLMPKINERA